MAPQEEEESKHIIMVPFMAQGHILPFLSLANFLLNTSPNHTITIVNTPLNIQSLKSSLPPNSPIHLIPLPFTPPSHYSLPPSAENTHSLPLTLIPNFMLASESLQPHFDTFIQNQSDKKCICIVADVFCGWTVSVARKHGVHHSVFTTCGAYGTLAYMSLWLKLPHLDTTVDDTFHVYGFPDSYTIHRSQISPFLRASTGTDELTLFYQRNIKQSLSSDLMLCNTVEEVEKSGVVLLEKFSGMKVLTVGPLLQVKNKSSACDIIKWLDDRAEGSVTYVCFGSQNSIKKAQMAALARGLEDSGKPFVWVVRPAIDSDTVEDSLPDGFEERNEEQGLVVRGWAPQLEILAHSAIALFVSHCGWNSTVESLSKGVPMLGWPLGAEQFFNIKMVEEELGVGVEIARGSESEVESEDIARAIREMSPGEEKGKVAKEKAARIAEMMKEAVEEEGSSVRGIKCFLDDVFGGRSIC